MKAKINRQNYSTEFKEDAIKLVLEQGYSCLQVGRRLGFHSTNVSHWVRQHRQDEEDIAEDLVQGIKPGDDIYMPSFQDESNSQIYYPFMNMVGKVVTDES
jgi:transposase-like protein